MDTGLITIQRLTDYAVVLAILQDPEIEAAIYEDTAELTMPDIAWEYWLGAYRNGKILGCYRVHKMGAILYQIHIRILPKHRVKSVEITKAALKWCAENIEDLETIVGYIPTAFPYGVKHVKACGFEYAGHIPNSYLRKGKVVGQDIYTISKEIILCQQQQ